MRHWSRYIIAAQICTMVASAHAFESIEQEYRRFESCDLQIVFEYPLQWGNPVITDHRGSTTKGYLLGGGGLDWELRFRLSGPEQFGVTLRIGEFASEDDLRTRVYEGWRDTTSIRELRDMVAADASRHVCGQPTHIEEHYFEPAGRAMRIITWLRGLWVYEVRVSAGVGAFDVVDYTKELGIMRLFELNPENRRLMEFQSAVNVWLASIECEN